MLRLVQFVGAYSAVRASGRFDAAHYIAQLKRVGWRRRVPLVHYLLSGERRGRQPFAGFSPILYAAEHDGLLPPGMSPLHHFVVTGGGGAGDGGRQRESVADQFGAADRAIRTIVSRNKIAVHCHLFYYDLLDEIAEALSPLAGEADLLFTVTDRPGFAELAARIARLWPGAWIIPFPNRGRDILPFLTLINSGSLGAYDAVCKIHTKKSPHHRDGDAWRRRLLRPLLDPAMVASVVARFREDPACGLVAADGALLSGERHWEATQERVRELAARIGIDIENCPLRFPAGSMYWVGQPILRELRRLGLFPANFEPEEGQVDNTTAHAVERLVGLIAQAKNLRMMEIGEVARGARHP